MALYILLFVLSIPAIEIAVFIKIGSSIGALNTIGVTFLTAVVGIVLVKRQGINILQTARGDILSRRAPINSVVNGVLVLLAGGLLLLPGFFTDLIGFILLIPPFRASIQNLISKRFFTSFKRSSDTSHDSHRQDTIDGDYQEINDYNNIKKK